MKDLRDNNLSQSEENYGRYVKYTLLSNPSIVYNAESITLHGSFSDDIDTITIDGKTALEFTHIGNKVVYSPHLMNKVFESVCLAKSISQDYQLLRNHSEMEI